MPVAVKLRKVKEGLCELEREQDVRERCFRRWVKEGKMTATDAKDRFERLATAIMYLRTQCNEHPEHLELIPAVVDGPAELKPKDGEPDDLPF